jgi:hypothetical protein
MLGTLRFAQPTTDHLPSPISRTTPTFSARCVRQRTVPQRKNGKNACINGIHCKGQGRDKPNQRGKQS